MLTSITDLTNKAFGCFYVLRPRGKRLLQGNQELASSRWVCKCNCGAVRYLSSEALFSGNTKKCGRKCILSSKVPEYGSWMRMKARYPRQDIYPKWYMADGFTYFLNDLGKKPDKLGCWWLSRIDFNRGFTPENCKWELRKIHCIRLKQWKISKGLALQPGTGKLPFNAPF